MSGTWGPGVDLASRFVECDSVTLLDLADELFAASLYLVDVVVGQFAPLLANATFELRPLPLECFVVHGCTSKQCVSWREAQTTSTVARPNRPHAKSGRCRSTTYAARRRFGCERATVNPPVNLAIHEASKRLSEERKSERERLLGDIVLKRTRAVSPDGLGERDQRRSQSAAISRHLSIVAALADMAAA